MKKFFSLMLVALLLVSALPFQALAADGAQVVMYVNGVQQGTRAIAATTNWVSNIAESVGYPYSTYHVEGYQFGTDASRTTGNASVTVADGDVLHINVEKHTITTTVTDATCEQAGQKVHACSGCSYSTTETIPALTHSWGSGTVTTAPTCNVAGERTYTCARNSQHTKTEVIPATGNHNFNAAGNCTVCGANDNKDRDQVVFYIDEDDAGVNKFFTETFVVGESITVPSRELISNYEFKGWYSGENGYGTQLTSGTTWRADMPTTWYAWYVYNPNNDHMSNITVTARCYVDGIGSSYHDVNLMTVALADGTNVFDWLTSNKNTTILEAVYSKVDTTKYEWKDRVFYNHNGSELETSQTVTADGPKSFLIKLVEKDDTTRANVQLYLHKSTTSENPFRILDMNGITSGMNVTRTTAKNLIDDYYDFDSIGNLYTHADWNALMNGENVDGRTSIYISDNGTYKIHVVVKNADAKSGAKADSTNPKTGDYITIAVGAMVMSAAAFITLAEMKKRKMI